MGTMGAISVTTKLAEGQIVDMIIKKPHHTCEVKIFRLTPKRTMAYVGNPNRPSYEAFRVGIDKLREI